LKKVYKKYKLGKPVIVGGSQVLLGMGSKCDQLCKSGCTFLGKMKDIKGIFYA